MGVINIWVVGGGHSELLGVAVMFRGVCWALIVATRASADGFLSSEFLMRAGATLDGRVFVYFPVGIVAKVVVIVG